MASSLHRRNPSHSDDESSTILKEPSPSARSRVNSTPMVPTSAGRSLPDNVPPPFRPPTFSTSGVLHGHSRTRSISNHYSPPLPSPLSFSFPNPQLATSISNPDSSTTSPTLSSQPALHPVLPREVGPPKHARRHSRLHSRNLSVFFPRPGSLPDPSYTISEDGAQEIEIRPEVVTTISSAPGMHRSRSDNPHTPFGAGFTFGSRPPSGVLPGQLSTSSSSSFSRRGHHHKHSLSHNFFSFLEPGGDLGGPSPTEELHTQPTITPQSPWTPNSVTEFNPAPATLISPQNGHAIEPEPTVPVTAMALACCQFILGAWLWVAGQQIGSLACTGLGYWVVFDSFGIVVARILPWYLDSRRQPTVRDIDAIQRPYGNARTQTVFVFSQAVYLLFSSVYVCKETVEHLLLSASSGEGHHHHHGDEQVGSGIAFPVVLIILSFISIVAGALGFDNHANLVQTAGNRITSLGDFVGSWSSSFHSRQEIPSSRAGAILSNPYALSPLLFCLSILFLSTSVSPSQHRTCDLVVACLITVVTFNVAFQASAVLGTVLLQTSPPRGLPGGKVEAFLRAMRELERHPQVLHLPPPHIWQLTPSMEIAKGSIPLVVTLELHVREDLSDDDVLILTAWAWERCVAALGGGTKVRNGDPKVEVTIGVVRG